jgi:hypothetical protein
VKAWMNGGVAPLGESTDEPPGGLGGERTRRWPRPEYAIALVWVAVGLALFLIEVVRVVVDRG